MDISRKKFEKESDIKKSFHPDAVMSCIIDTVIEIGAHKFLHGSGLNKEREGLIASLFTYAVRKRSQREWFIQQIQDPPDFYIISPAGRVIKEKPFDRIGIEIVEIKDKIKESAIKTIERTKLKNYSTDQNTALLIFINSKIRVEDIDGLRKWISQNKNKFLSFSETYILFLGKFSKETIWDYKLINVFKDWTQSCILKNEFNKGIIFPNILIGKYGVNFID